VVVEHRPKRLVVVVGTGTEVGKTWVSAQLLVRLSIAGVDVAARKLAQSYEAGDDPTTLDGAILASATGEPPHEVCPAENSYPIALAPPMAAAALELDVPTLEDLLDMWPWPDGCELGLVETAGGLRSPQASDGDALDVVAALEPDLVLLVADAGLGTVNSVRLTLEALAGVVGPDGSAVPVALALNRFDVDHEVHRRNRAWLAERCGIDAVGLPDEIPRLADSVAGGAW